RKHDLPQYELDRGRRRHRDERADDAQESTADEGADDRRRRVDVHRPFHHSRVDQVVFHLLVDQEEDERRDAYRDRDDERDERDQSGPDRRPDQRDDVGDHHDQGERERVRRADRGQVDQRRGAGDQRDDERTGDVPADPVQDFFTQKCYPGP